jgi:HEAT repeat protein
MSSGESNKGTQIANESTSSRAVLERKSTEELFASTLEGDYEDDSAWEAVSVLRLRGTIEVFDLAKRYCDSQDPRARARALSVLAQLGAGKPDIERPFKDESVSIAINHLQDSDTETARCAAWALSHLGTQQAVRHLVTLKDHPDPEVRQAVACCTELRSHPDAVGVLLTLMEDSDDEVRDWATFSLGSGEVETGGVWHYVDSPEVRTAFCKRLEDGYEEARREAIWGLAKRKDAVGLKLLLSQLESPEWWSGDEDAAAELLGLSDATVEELCSGLRKLLA